MGGYREVSEEEGVAKARKLSTQHIETSAKTGLNVRQLFTKLAQSLPGATDGAAPGDSTAATSQCTPFLRDHSYL